MKVSGFTIIRDGVRLGYPFEESIRSILPLCDEFVVAVGASDDGTLERLEALNEPKLRVIETVWNEHCRTHGYVVAQQKMTAQYNCTGDWAFYLESDEILHEDDIEHVRTAMEFYLDKRQVEALVFDYYHFYGDARHLNVYPSAYRKAARVIRNSLRSIAPDGLYWAVIKDKTWHGSRNKRRTRYPRAAALNVPIYHYGNCRHEELLKAKADIGNRYWEKQAFDSCYGDISPDAIERFDGCHPAVMKSWLQSHANPGFAFNPGHRPSRRERKHRLVHALERKFGWDLSKRHFKIVDRFKPG
jgi:glycosyltransferase involved in cell wall biosynthesis